MTLRSHAYWALTVIFTAAALGIIGFTVSPVIAHTVEKGDVMIIHPWVEPSGGGDTFAHPTISNEGDRPLVLLRIETSAAEKVDILRNGKAISNLLIKGGDIIAFDSPEAQIKLTKLTEPLIEGTHFPARLVFTRNVNVDLEMVVGQDTMMPELSSSDHDEDHEHNEGDQH